MSERRWIIVGATSIIAREFAHLTARAGYQLLLVGRHAEQLKVIAADIRLRYGTSCEIFIVDFAKDNSFFLQFLQKHNKELNLFIAHALMFDNDSLTASQIDELLNVNVAATIQIIHAYMKKKQSMHHLLFLSSVAACRGRAKNSLYGASKAAVEVYLQGLQVAATPSQQISIIRLGFIDTKLTYGEPGVFYASSPKRCAKACWYAIKNKKRMIYFPWFWRFIMAIVRCLPFNIYQKLFEKR